MVCSERRGFIALNRGGSNPALSATGLARRILSPPESHRFQIEAPDKTGTGIVQGLIRPETGLFMGLQRSTDLDLTPDVTVAKM